MSDWSLGLTMTIMGMGMVFLVLAILVVLVYLFNWIYYRYVERPQTQVGARQSALTPAAGGPQAAGQGLTPEPAVDCLPPEKVAAVMAAITAMVGPERGLRLVKVGPAQRNLSWAAAGRQDIINQRQKYLSRKE